MSDRIHSIDTLRAVAIFFIVIAHVQPFRGFGTYGNYVYFVMDTIGQFDVPFFFVTSGYFFAETVSIDNVKSTVSSSVRKLGSIYLFGRLLSVAAVIGLALFRGVPVANALIARGIDEISTVDLLYYGNALSIPLWFLTALIFSLVLVGCFVEFGKTRYLLPVAALVHIVGLVGTNYQMIVDVPFRTRDALFFGFFYVALGYQISSIDWTPDENRRHIYLGIVALLAGVQLIEQYAIGYVIRDNVLRQEIYSTEYTLSTIFFVLALFAYVLSNPQWGKNTILPRVGRHALGIYLLHVPLLRLFRTMNRVWGPMIEVNLTSTLLWHLAIPLVVYVLSLVIYLLMAKMHVIELGGSHTPWLNRILSRGRISVRNRSPDDN
ncbi:MULTISPECIES: acyltransferase [unclassified Haladaptatus]|uniref:acyltransferase n=1 Tax=unclassified Haladaptatus TaxID=2622732 RepID=UPI00209C1AF4|nr:MULTISPECIES: acyltransferase [unclassified Haladaptatus]MCO8244786.1 acyltransferase [Haladaptatus sp. AB643]MCO8255702.1 acyltransferase [Haladaptatus sp. AB618]